MLIKVSIYILVQLRNPIEGSFSKKNFILNKSSIKNINPSFNKNNTKRCFCMAQTCMTEQEIEEFVDNFKGMLWDELDDAVNCMTKEDLAAAVRALKKRFG